MTEGVVLVEDMMEKVKVEEVMEVVEKVEVEMDEVAVVKVGEVTVLEV